MAREPNPDHQRSPLAALTAEGRTVLDELFGRSTANRAALLDRAGGSVTELDEARRVIRALLDAFGE